MQLNQQRITSGDVLNGRPGDKVNEMNNLKNEMQRVRKDKDIMSGLITTMQQDMSSKDSTISRCTREIESLKKELREKDVQVAAVNAKVFC